MLVSGSDKFLSIAAVLFDKIPKTSRFFFSAPALAWSTTLVLWCWNWICMTFQNLRLLSVNSVPCSFCSCKMTPTPQQQSQPAALYRRCLPSKTRASFLVKLIVAVFIFPVPSTLSVNQQQSQPLCKRCLKPSKTCACSLVKLVRLFQNFYTALNFILQNDSRANQLLSTSVAYPRLAPALSTKNLQN